MYFITMHIHDLLGDGQTQAASSVLGAGVFAFDEGFKKFFFGFCYCIAAVSYGEEFDTGKFCDFKTYFYSGRVMTDDVDYQVFYNSF